MSVGGLFWLPLCAYRETGNISVGSTKAAVEHILLMWVLRTIFPVFAATVWPVSTTTCALSVTGEVCLSRSSWINMWTCLQTGTCVFQGRWKLLQGQPIHRLLFGSYHQVRKWPGWRPRPLSCRHWWNICVCFQHKRKQRAGKLPLQRYHQRWILSVWVSLQQISCFRRTAWLWPSPLFQFCSSAFSTMLISWRSMCATPCWAGSAWRSAWRQPWARLWQGTATWVLPFLLTAPGQMCFRQIKQWARLHWTYRLWYAVKECQYLFCDLWLIQGGKVQLLLRFRHLIVWSHL